jgi:hypothetical protein
VKTALSYGIHQLVQKYQSTLISHVIYAVHLKKKECQFSNNDHMTLDMTYNVIGNCTLSLRVHDESDDQAYQDTKIKRFTKNKTQGHTVQTQHFCKN